jgi:hypothetical protein
LERQGERRADRPALTLRASSAFRVGVNIQRPQRFDQIKQIPRRDRRGHGRDNMTSHCPFAAVTHMDSRYD